MARPTDPVFVAAGLLLAALPAACRAAESAGLAEAHAAAAALVTRYCHECHANGVAEGDRDLAAVTSLAAMRRDVRLWERVAEVVASREMPPREADQPTPAERETLARGLQAFLAAEALAHAGDPGRVELRRLSNAEYTSTIRDLTGVDSLDPAREFPADAGEGGTNSGSMGEALVAKLLDAAKGVAGHAVPLPEGLRFSPSAERGDWIEESLARLREFYRRFTVPRSGIAAMAVQGIAVDPGHEGFLPVERYLAATLAARQQLRDGGTTIEAVARDRGLSPKYLGMLWQMLDGRRSADGGSGASLLLDRLRARWQAAPPEEAAALAAGVAEWQSALWKFNPVGHIARQYGRKGGPAAWIEPVSPLVEQKEFRIPLKPTGGGDIHIRLDVGDAGDGREQDVVVWKNPRIVSPGAADLPLRDAARIGAKRAEAVASLTKQTAACLAAVDELLRPADAAAETGPVAEEQRLRAAARRHAVDPLALAGWAASLGIAGPAGPPARGDLIAKTFDAGGARRGIVGWAGPNALSVIANTTDKEMRIPGAIPAGAVAVHPAPDRRVIVAWRAPAGGLYRANTTVTKAHVGCGNGVEWSLELRRGSMRQSLVEGAITDAVADRAPQVRQLADIPLAAGDFLCLVVGPRNGDHSCDLTAVAVEIASGDRAWRLADVAGTLDAANPRADAFGNADAWSFASEPTATVAARIPAGSLLARWQLEPDAARRAALAEQLQALLLGAAPPTDQPDGILHRRLLAFTGPLLAAAVPDEPAEAGSKAASPLPFGRPAGGLAGGLSVDAVDLCMQPPAAVEFTLPADLGGEFVVTAAIHPQAGGEATVQAIAKPVQPSVKPVQPPATTGTAAVADLSPTLPILARPDSAGWRRIEKSLADFRELLPPVVCYGRIVPVDEPVTFNLLYREDDRLKRLLLTDADAAELDRLWDELLFVSEEPLEILDVYEQILEYTTQDRSVLGQEFQAVRGPLEARAEAFRRRRVEVAEPAQVEAAVGFAERAFRRPLAADEAAGLRGLYAALRAEKLPHDEALRLMLARVLVSPDFLYKVETPGPGAEPRPLGDHELASRLSYFLWSSLPDAALLREAAAGRLHEPEVLLAQMHRMLADPRVRRLATEFGTRWLHVGDFDKLDEKSPEAFPMFASLRAAMHEEAVLLLADLFQNDRPIRSLIDADHTFLNEQLAAFYGIPGVKGPEWRRVERVRQHGRGGVLGLAATLAKQSGASRTSPILRGTWFTEVLLGQRVPKPPKGVPPLAESPPAGLSERELTALHSQDAACAGCHARFDPFGYALEEFDAIGRRRSLDVAGNPIDATATLPDGTAVAGQADLCRYLATVRSDDFVRQFCRKLLAHALRRDPQLSDAPLLDEMQARLGAADGRVSAAIEAIVTSPQFLQIRGADAPDGG